MLFKKRKKYKRYITVDQYEYRLMLEALLSLRDKLIKQGKYTDVVDETIEAISK